MNVIALVARLESDALGLRVLIFLGVLVVALWSVARAMPRLRRRMQGGKSHRVQVLERTWVEGKRSLVVVRFDGREFLLGSTESGLQVIHVDPTQTPREEEPASWPSQLP